MNKMKMNTRLFFVTFSLALTACGGSEYSIDESPSFTADTEQAVRRPVDCGRVGEACDTAAGEGAYEQMSSDTWDAMMANRDNPRNRPNPGCVCRVGATPTKEK